MRLALAGLGALAVAVVAVFVVAISATNDDTPDALRRCLEKTDAIAVHGPDTLGGLRRDLVLRTPPRVRRLRIGDNDGALLTGTGYSAIVLAGRGSPSLDGDLGLSVYRHADAYAVVAVEPGAGRDMAACARTVE